MQNIHARVPGQYEHVADAWWLSGQGHFPIVLIQVDHPPKQFTVIYHVKALHSDSAQSH